SWPAAGRPSGSEKTTSRSTAPASAGRLSRTGTTRASATPRPAPPPPRPGAPPGGSGRRRAGSPGRAAAPSHRARPPEAGGGFFPADRGERRWVRAESAPRSGAREQPQGVLAEDPAPILRGQEVRAVPHVRERLAVGAVAADVRHVGAPDEPAGAEPLVRLAE